MLILQARKYALSQFGHMFGQFGHMFDTTPTAARDTPQGRFHSRGPVPGSAELFHILRLVFESFTQKTTPSDLSFYGGCSSKTFQKIQCKEYRHGNK